ncbi:hypothetical protein LINGRAHAP2_LOCUS23759, partial [Linum grandiflorum]
RYRALSKTTTSLIRYTVNKPIGAKPIATSTASLLPARPSSSLSRPVAQVGALQSLLPLAASSLFQDMLYSANPGV